MNSVVSVIIPVFNRVDLIITTLESILKQDYVQWECLIVDDGSTDSTFEAVKEFIKEIPNMQVYKRPVSVKKGANACRNFGLTKAKGEYIIFFDSDDIMLPSYMSTQMQYIMKGDNDMSICKVAFFDENSELKERERPAYSENLYDDYITKRLTILICSVLWKKQFVLTHKLIYDQELQAGQEWDFMSRAFMCKPNGIYAAHTLVHIREHNNSISYGNIKNANYHYVNARVNFFHDYRETLSVSLKKYFQGYFIDHFKKSLRNGWFDISLDIYRKYFSTTRQTFKFMALSLIAITLFRITNRGEFVLKYLKEK